MFVDFYKFPVSDSFSVKRDKKREYDLFNKIDIKYPYVFIHEDKERNFLIKEKYTNNKTLIYFDEKLTNNVFDWLTIIENASEAHVIDSCFLNLLDIIKIKIPVYFHKYSRPLIIEGLTPQIKSNFTTLND